MSGLARALLIVAAVAGGILITPDVTLTGKGNSPLVTASTDVFQRFENATMRGPGRPAAEDARRLQEEKYELLARVETGVVNSEGGSRLTLTLRNNTHDVIYIIERIPTRDFRLEIKDDSGKAVLPRDNDLQGLTINEGKQSLVPVDPGEQVSYVIDIGYLYSLAGGEYTLTTKTIILLGDKQTTVTVESAPIRFVLKSTT